MHDVPSEHVPKNVRIVRQADLGIVRVGLRDRKNLITSATRDYKMRGIGHSLLPGLLAGPFQITPAKRQHLRALADPAWVRGEYFAPEQEPHRLPAYWPVI